MPNLDTTGPDGVGPTGLQRGKCLQTSSVPVRPFGRRGMGMGMGMGMGRCRCPYVVREDVDDALLEEEENLLQERLEMVRKARKELQEKK
jgi:hypothetical protein